MSFSMQTSGATFKSLMRELLRDNEDYADTYIDDTVVFSDSWADHCKHLKDISDCLRKADMIAKTFFYWTVRGSLSWAYNWERQDKA